MLSERISVRMYHCICLCACSTDYVAYVGEWIPALLVFLVNPSLCMYVCMYMYVCINASLYLSVCVCLSARLPGCFSFEPITKRFTSEELTMVALPSPRVFPEVPRRCFRWPASPNHSFGNCTEVESVSPWNCLVF